VDRLPNVLSIPVQAVVQVASDTWCYVDRGGSLERCPLKLGMTNDKFVEITDGLSEGDRVVLNPTAILEETEGGESSISPDEEPEDSSAATGESLPVNAD
jgi:hypothetical protein